MINTHTTLFAVCENCEWRGSTGAGDALAIQHANYRQHTVRVVIERRYAWEPDVVTQDGSNDLSSSGAGAPKM